MKGKNSREAVMAAAKARKAGGRTVKTGMMASGNDAAHHAGRQPRTSSKGAPVHGKPLFSAAAPAVK